MEEELEIKNNYLYVLDEILDMEIVTNSIFFPDKSILKLENDITVNIFNFNDAVICDIISRNKYFRIQYGINILVSCDCTLRVGSPDDLQRNFIDLINIVRSKNNKKLII